jgi:hypothetical protein
VTYGSLNVDEGNELTPTQVKDPPTIKWGADDDSYYLLCMTGMYAYIVATARHLMGSALAHVILPGDRINTE